MALLLEGFQDHPHAVGAADIEILADFAHGGWAMGVLNLVPNEIQDLALAMGQRSEALFHAFNIVPVWAVGQMFSAKRCRVGMYNNLPISTASTNLALMVWLQAFVLSASFACFAALMALGSWRMIVASRQADRLFSSQTSEHA